MSRQSSNLLQRYMEDIRSKLTMHIQGSGEPFSLTNAEQAFSPDDWAWQFLRLSTEYRNDYAKARDAGLLRNSRVRSLYPTDTKSIHAL